MDSYPFRSSIQVRWRDLDALAHVNNAAIVTYLETARTVLWRERFGGGAEIPFVITRVVVEYRRAITLDDEVVVGLGVSEIRGASFTFAYRVEAAGELAAEAETTLGYVDPKSGRVARIPAELRKGLERLRIG